MKKPKFMATLLTLSALALLGALPHSARAEAPKAAAPKVAELTACLGGSDNGAPVVFASLTKKMSPAEIGAIWKGAEAISKFGLSKVKAKDCAGAAEFEFIFTKDKANGDAFGLIMARIVFDRKLVANEGFYTDVLNVLSAKYGEPKPAEIEKKLITWISKDKRLVQFVMFPSMKGKQFQLSVGLR